MIGNYWLEFCSLLIPHLSITNEWKSLPQANNSPSSSFAPVHTITVTSVSPCLSKCWMFCKAIMSALESGRLGVLGLCTTDIWGWIILCGRAILCLAGCAAVSLTSTHQMPVARLLGLVTTNVSRHYLMFLRGQNCLFLRNTVNDVGSNPGSATQKVIQCLSPDILVHLILFMVVITVRKV